MAADQEVLVADYPILPVRRRLWERFLRAVDASGTQAQLRNQLRVVHEAAKQRKRPLGHVVGGDFIYDQNSASLLQTAALPKETYEHVLRLGAGGSEEKLKAASSRWSIWSASCRPKLALTWACGPLQTSSPTCCDDLPGARQTRASAWRPCSRAACQGCLVLALDGEHGTEYRLQTKESSAWQTAFRQHEAELRGASARVENERADKLRARFGE